MKTKKIIELITVIIVLIFFAQLVFSETAEEPANDFFFYISPTVYYNTNPFFPEDVKTNLPDFYSFYEYESIPYFAEIGWKNHMGNLETYFSLPIRRSCIAASENMLGTNLPYKGMDIDTTFPFKGYLYFNFDYMGFKLARDKLDIGPGYWSSVELNKQNPYWDYLQFYYKADYFRMDEYIIRLNPFLVATERSAQDHMEGYHIWDPNAYGERVKTIIVHNFSWLIANSFLLSVGEFLLIGGRSIQISDFNPMLVFHNFYGEDWGNVYAFLNIKYQPVSYFKVYFDIVIDDLVSPVEINDKNTNPNALGVLFGTQVNLLKLAWINLFFAADAAYVSPTFGIRSQPLQTFYARMMYLDNTVGGRRLYVDYPVGFYMGNDLIDFRIKLMATLINKYEFSLDYHLLFKGEETLHSNPMEEGEGIYKGYWPRGVVETMNEIKAECKISINKRYSLSINGKVVLLKNKDHIEGTNSFNYGAGTTFTMKIF